MGQEFFELTQKESASIVSLRLPEAMDSSQFDRLNDEMLTLFGSQPQGRWVLDLSGVSYMGSSALGLMVNIRQRVKQAGGQLVLCGLSPRLLQVFKTCCMERLFRVARTLDQALWYLGG